MKTATLKRAYEQAASERKEMFELKDNGVIRTFHTGYAKYLVEFLLKNGKDEFTIKGS